MKPVPDGWRNFKSMGELIPGTRFIPFKAPLKQTVCEKKLPPNEWFTPSILMEKCPQIRAIIDLTNTTKNTYYNPEVFRDLGVIHRKVRIEGGGLLPPSSKVSEFCAVVDELLQELSEDHDALIGVHCTHGLNRTGYFICKYMVSRMKMYPREAISKFESARGHHIERKLLVQDVLRQDSSSWRSNPHHARNPVPDNLNNFGYYRSPLDGSHEDLPRSRYRTHNGPYSRDGTSTGSYNRRYEGRR